MKGERKMLEAANKGPDDEGSSCVEISTAQRTVRVLIPRQRAEQVGQSMEMMQLAHMPAALPQPPIIPPPPPPAGS